MFSVSFPLCHKKNITFFLNLKAHSLEDSLVCTVVAKPVNKKYIRPLACNLNCKKIRIYRPTFVFHSYFSSLSYGLTRSNRLVTRVFSANMAESSHSGKRGGDKPEEGVATPYYTKALTGILDSLVITDVRVLRGQTNDE